MTDPLDFISNHPMPDMSDWPDTRQTALNVIRDAAGVPKSMFATSGTGPASDPVDLIKKLKDAMDRFLTPMERARTLVVQDAKMLGPSVPNVESMVGEIKVVECPFLEKGTMYWLNDPVPFPIVVNPAFEAMDTMVDRRWRYEMQMELGRQSCAVRFRLRAWPAKYRGPRRRTRGYRPMPIPPSHGKHDDMVDALGYAMEMMRKETRR